MTTRPEYRIRNGQLLFEDGTTLTVSFGLAEPYEIDAHLPHPPQPPTNPQANKVSRDRRRRYLFAGV